MCDDVPNIARGVTRFQTYQCCCGRPLSLSHELLLSMVHVSTSCSPLCLSPCFSFKRLSPSAWSSWPWDWLPSTSPCQKWTLLRPPYSWTMAATPSLSPPTRPTWTSVCRLGSAVKTKGQVKRRELRTSKGRRPGTGLGGCWRTKTRTRRRWATGAPTAMRNASMPQCSWPRTKHWRATAAGVPGRMSDQVAVRRWRVRMTHLQWKKKHWSNYIQPLFFFFSFFVFSTLTLFKVTVMCQNSFCKKNKKTNKETNVRGHSMLRCCRMTRKIPSVPKLFQGDVVTLGSVGFWVLGSLFKVPLLSAPSNPISDCLLIISFLMHLQCNAYLHHCTVNNFLLYYDWRYFRSGSAQPKDWVDYW